MMKPIERDIMRKSLRHSKRFGTTRLQRQQAAQRLTETTSTPLGKRYPPYGAETTSMHSMDAVVPEPQWEFERDRLYIRERIGEGLFGEVWRARADGIMGRKGHTVVAVKVLKDDHTEEERRSMQRELNLMKNLQPHPNIVTLLGHCTINGMLNQIKKKILLVITSMAFFQGILEGLFF